jgi:hypothetical protein
MPRHKEGFTQLAFEMPDELVAALRAAAESKGLTLTAFISSTCGRAVGVEYTPPKLGRPSAAEEPPPAPPKERRGKRPQTPPPASTAPKRKGKPRTAG